LLDIEDSCGRILEPQACDVKSSQVHCSGTSSSLLNELAQKLQKFSTLHNVKVRFAKRFQKP
jgi:hypothetical protein